MYIFGIDVPILELLVIFSIVVVVYLVILEFEFRQLRVITRKFDEEELQLSNELRELRKEITNLREAIKPKG
jgi:predicted Holliday junction resolvase-like endonuclease